MVFLDWGDWYFSSTLYEKTPMDMGHEKGGHL